MHCMIEMSRGWYQAFQKVIQLSDEHEAEVLFHIATLYNTKGDNKKVCM